MNDIRRYEYLFLGGGKGGKSLAMDLARHGKRVAVIERGLIGGSCINIACIPSKTLIQNARNMHVRRAFGRDPDVVADMIKVSANVQNVVRGMVELNHQGFVKSGLELVIGVGRFVAPRRISVRLDDGTEQVFEGDNVYINTGTTAAVPDIPGLSDASPLTHVEALRLESLPSHLIVLGGGYIGLELAQAYRRLGSEVTLVHNASRLVDREDEDVSAEIEHAFRDEAIELRLGTRAVEVRGKSGEGVTVHLDNGAVVAGSHILVATGRKAMTTDIGLDLAGVEVDGRGFIKVDDKLATTAERT
ncbi:mercuric reductase, putative, partial [Ricinus communis]